MHSLVGSVSLVRVQAATAGFPSAASPPSACAGNGVTAEASDDSSKPGQIINIRLNSTNSFIKLARSITRSRRPPGKVSSAQINTISSGGTVPSGGGRQPSRCGTAPSCGCRLSPSLVLFSHSHCAWVFLKNKHHFQKDVDFISTNC